MRASVAKILVVDDEPNIREVVGQYLRRDGYAVVSAADGEEALRAYKRERPDLVVLDMMLPKLGGLEVYRRLLGAEGRVPLIMLTARGEEEDRIMGLRMGADDYVVKPFSPRELVARVGAVLRRAGEDAFAGTRENTSLRRARDRSQHAGGNGQRRARDAHGAGVRLLYYLASQPKRVFTRDQLMEEVWGYTFAAETSTVPYTCAGCARRSVEADSAQPRYLQTVWGVGYRFGGG